ncbi:MAG: hypothetical protein JXA89_21010, partial [Anaerolineae bacterium]|nr:hypothetical protein [Anaerolineae bacterium]
LAAANHGYPEYNIDSGIYCLVGQSAKDVLAGAETTIEQIEKEGLDTSSLTTMLSEARAALANGDPERAKQLASETKTMADKLLAVYQAIQDAQAAIQEAEDLGCVTKEAQNKLDDAIDALNEANTDVAAQYARESLSLAGKVVCGRVRIVDLKALAARYDGRIIELSGTIRNMETIYAQGYRFTIDDGTDLIGIRHLGSMHKIDTGDTVIVRGTFSKSSGTVEAESVEKSGLGGFLTNKLLWVIVLCALGALGLAGVIVGILFYIREVNKGRMMA